jgi:hypothetical protein
LTKQQLGGGGRERVEQCRGVGAVARRGDLLLRLRCTPVLLLCTRNGAFSYDFGLCLPLPVHLCVPGSCHCGNRLDVETADSQELVEFPWDYFETAVSAGDERFVAAQVVEFGSGHVTENDDPEFAVEAGAGEQHVAGELFANPGQVIVEAGGDRLVSIANPSVQRQVSHFGLPFSASTRARTIRLTSANAESSPDEGRGSFL